MSKQPNRAATGASSKLAALEKRVAEQGRMIRAQAAMLETAGQQLHYLGTLAGTNKEFDAIKAQGAKKIADIMNPAQPIPDPPSSGPTESTEQAEQPETFDDPRNPGLTPGSTQGVPAQQVDTPLQPGATLPTAPFNQMVDVTQPVAGTETHVPNNQTKIETDVRVMDDPMNGQGPSAPAFPLNPAFAPDGAASVGTAQQVGGPGRTMASIHLARLRKRAGLVSPNVDDLVEGAKIEKDASLTEEAIRTEIRTLEGVAKVASAQAQVRRPQGGPIPRTARADRRAPSLAANTESVVALASAGVDEDDASDLFLD